MSETKTLFTLDVDKQSWEHIFQSIDAFERVIKAIFERHGLPLTTVENLTSGTNAVFKVGDKVVKIFAPVESGYYDTDYFDIEKEAQMNVNSRHVASPRLLHEGVIEDKYVFRYIVMDFVMGQEAGQALEGYTRQQKQDFAAQIRDITRKINICIQPAAIPVLTIDTCLTNHRWTWDGFPTSFCDDRAAVIQGLNFDNLVYVHGDLTAENMIIRGDGTVCLIDFADSIIAPYYYEWLPIVFGLFRCCPVMMAAYFGEYRNDDFFDVLKKAVLIHEFGAGSVRELCEDNGVDIGTLVSVSQLRALIRDICLQAAAQPA